MQRRTSAKIMRMMAARALCACQYACLVGIARASAQEKADSGTAAKSIVQHYVELAWVVDLQVEAGHCLKLCSLRECRKVEKCLEAVLERNDLQKTRCLEPYRNRPVDVTSKQRLSINSTSLPHATSPCSLASPNANTKGDMR